MAARKPNTQTQNNRNDDVEARVSLLEYQFREVQRGLGRIETKQDAAIRQIDTMDKVSNHEFDSYVKDASKTFATIADVNATKRLVYWILGLVGGIFIGVTLAIVGVVLR